MNRGDLFWADPGGTLGYEFSGQHLWIVIAPRIHRVLTAIPLTSEKDGDPLWLQFGKKSGIYPRIKENGRFGLHKNCYALCDQIRTFDDSARGFKILNYFVDDDDLREIDKALLKVLGIRTAR